MVLESSRETEEQSRDFGYTYSRNDNNWNLEPFKAVPSKDRNPAPTLLNLKMETKQNKIKDRAPSSLGLTNN